MKRGFLIFIVVCGVLQGSLINAKERDSNTDAILKYAKACGIVVSNYVDSVNTRSLTTTAIESMVSSLDPYSTYLSAEQVKTANELLFDGFEGIGVRYNIENDTVVILQVVRDGPSEKAGLRPSDKILFADTTAVAGVDVTIEELRDLIRGPKGTAVNLTLLRGSDTLKVSVKRERIEARGVSDYFMFTSETGFIRVDCFSEGSGKEFEKALTVLEKEGARKYLLDFRGNGGGLLSEAVSMLSCLLPQGTELYTAQGVHRGAYVAKAERQRHSYIDAPIAVLIDGGSASASEVFAGALQDWKRAVVVGWRSYGKGTVQQSYPLGDGSEVRLTVARYLTPSGRNIQKPYKNGEYLPNSEGGIIPDVIIESPQDSTLIPRSYYLRDAIKECAEVRKALEILENK